MGVEIENIRDQIKSQDPLSILSEYISNWHQIEGIKPENEDVFIDNFIYFLNSLDDDRDISFDGDSSYNGKQISIIKDNAYCGHPYLAFEINYIYGKFLSVYTKNHHGFWTPEYIEIRTDVDQMNHSKFGELQTALFDAMYRLFGLPKPDKF